MCLCALPIRGGPYFSVCPSLPQLEWVRSACVDLNSYKRLPERWCALGMAPAAGFRTLSKLLKPVCVHFSHLRIHEVGLLQLFKDVLENTGFFSIPVLSSLECGLSLGVTRRQVHPSHHKGILAKKGSERKI